MCTKGGKEVRQSSELTLARYASSNPDIVQPRLGLVENRIKYRIIERLQSMFEGIPLDGSIPVDECHYHETVLSIPISEILLDNSKNYSGIRTAGRKLMTHIFSYEDENYEWVDFVMVSKIAKTRKGEGALVLTVTSDFIRCLAMQGGWQTFYDVDVMCELSSTYAMRLYELVSRKSGVQHTISKTLDELKQMFGLDGKYNDPHNFDVKIMDTAKRELDSKSPYTFNYVRVRNINGDWSYRISPVYQPRYNRTDTEGRSLRRRISLCMCIPKDIERFFLDKEHGFGFTYKEVQRNLDTFMAFMKLKTVNHRAVIVDLYGKSEGKENPRGWFIGALRKIIEENAE